MEKWASFVFVLAILAVFSYGCAGVSKEITVRCPKCRAFFTIDETLAEGSVGWRKSR